MLVLSKEGLLVHLCCAPDCVPGGIEGETTPSGCDTVPSSGLQL